jgi:hypothetical protein
LVVEVLRYDASLLEIGIKLRLSRIDTLDKFARLTLEVPELMVLKFIPVNSLNRVFLKELLEQIIEFDGETIDPSEIRRDYHCYEIFETLSAERRLASCHLIQDAT